MNYTIKPSTCKLHGTIIIIIIVSLNQKRIWLKIACRWAIYGICRLMNKLFSWTIEFMWTQSMTVIIHYIIIIFAPCKLNFQFQAFLTCNKYFFLMSFDPIWSTDLILLLLLFLQSLLWIIKRFNGWNTCVWNTHTTSRTCREGIFSNFKSSSTRNDKREWRTEW